MRLLPILAIFANHCLQNKIFFTADKGSTAVAKEKIFLGENCLFSPLLRTTEPRLWRVRVYSSRRLCRGTRTGGRKGGRGFARRPWVECHITIKVSSDFARVVQLVAEGMSYIQSFSYRDAVLPSLGILAGNDAYGADDCEADQWEPHLSITIER